MIYIFIIPFMIILSSCSTAPAVGDRELKGNEVPEFLARYKHSHKDATFYEKIYKNHHSYEVKFEEDDRETSLTFDSNGAFVEKEEDISLDELPPKVRDKILSYLKGKYPQNEILEVEKRELHDGTNLIDVEIRHESSESGYWEITFSQDGNYVSREIEDYRTRQTLY